MKLTTKARYAVMALLDMMSFPGNAPISLVSIAERQSLPLPYLEQIFSKLRKKDIVQSVRGAAGGYAFARPTHEISLNAVITAVDKEFRARRCMKETVGCQPGGTFCVTHHLWMSLDQVIETFFSTITLQDIYSNDVQRMHFSLLLPKHAAHSSNTDALFNV